jgi:hypothetical protein
MIPAILIQTTLPHPDRWGGAQPNQTIMWRARVGTGNLVRGSEESSGTCSVLIWLGSLPKEQGPGSVSDGLCYWGQGSLTRMEVCGDSEVTCMGQKSWHQKNFSIVLHRTTSRAESYPTCLQSPAQSPDTRLMLINWRARKRAVAESTLLGGRPCSRCQHEPRRTM